MTQYVRTDAVVLGAEVVSYSGSARDTSGASYLPVVHYQYVVDGVTHRSKDVFPTTVGHGSIWGLRSVTAVVKSFEKGQQTQAYYDPSNPGNAFLIKRPAIFPYIFILLPSILGLAGFAAIVLPALGRSDATKRRGVIAIVIAWYGVGLLCAVHYYSLAGANTDSLAGPIFGGYAVMGLVGVIYLLPRRGIGGRFKAAALFSLVGAFLGFWCGMVAGWLAGLISKGGTGGPFWAWYGVQIGAAVFALLGFTGGKVNSK